MIEETLNEIMDQAEKESKKPKVSIVMQLVQLVNDQGASIYLDQNGDPHITLPDQPMVGLPINSQGFRRWLAGKRYEQNNTGFSSETYSQIVNTLEGKAISEKNTINLYTRIAKIGSIIYYDLGNDNTIVKITPDKWEVTDKCPIRFRRFSHQSCQVLPDSGGDLTTILKYFNLNQENEKILLVTYLVSAMIPDIPRVNLIITGEQGAAKSTGLNVLRSIIDPSMTPLLSPIKDASNLFDTASQHYCFYLDNLSYISDDISDAICRLVTGGSISKRKLYTDSEQVIRSLRLAVGMTGINIIANRADLLDRSLILTLDRIPDSQRLDETDFWSKFEEDRPKILGALFTAVSKTLEIRPKLSLSNMPRMADYFQYAVAASISLGHSQETFQIAWSSNALKQNQTALESSPTAQVIISYMENRDNWSGSSSDLYRELSGIATNLNLVAGGPGGFPKSSHYLWQRIQVIKPNLASIGIVAHYEQMASHSKITLLKQPNEMATMATNNSVLDTSINNERIVELCLKLQEGLEWKERNQNRTEDINKLNLRAQIIIDELVSLGINRTVAESLFMFPTNNLEGVISSLFNTKTPLI